MTIPKRIFYVWGVNEPKNPGVQFCLESWKRILHDYEIIEINEDSIEYFNFQEELKNNKWFRTVYERKMYAYVSDYVRIKALYENGGVYLDTDVTTLKSFDQFLEEPAFVGMQDNDEDEGHRSLVEPAILGATSHNKFLKKILDFYEENTIDNIWNQKIYNMPDIFNFLLEQNYEKQIYPARTKQHVIKYNDISIYPEKYFIPFRYSEKFTPKCIHYDTHTIHWFNASWIRPEILFFLENKHKIPLGEINKAYSICSKQASKNNLIQNIFSVKNTNDKTEKIVTVFGFKFHYKRKDINNA